MDNNVSRKLAGAFGGKDPRNARQVHGDRNVGPFSLRVENPPHVFGGIVSQFEDQYAAIAQQAASLINQALINFDSCGSAEESSVRLVVAHFALQMSCFTARDVWWIADDQIEQRFRLMPTLRRHVALPRCANQYPQDQ